MKTDGDADAEATEASCLRPCMVCLAGFLILPRTTWHANLDPPTSIINQINAPQANLVGGGFSIRVPLSKMTPVCVKMT